MDCGHTWIFGQNLWTDVDENFRIRTPPLLTETETRRTNYWVAGGSRAARATHVVPATLLSLWVAQGVDCGRLFDKWKAKLSTNVGLLA